MIELRPRLVDSVLMMTCLRRRAPLLSVPSGSARAVCSTSSTAEPGSHLLGSSHHAKGLVDTKGWNDGPEKPCLVSEQGDEDGGSPGNPDDIEHVLSEALGGEVLARFLEGAGGGVIAGPARVFEESLAEEAREGAEEPPEEGARPEDKVEGEEDECHDERADVEVVERRRIGFGAVLASFLGHGE